MKINNRLDYFFGPAGVFSGYLLIIFGIFFAMSFTGLFALLIGAIVAFTHTGTTIDTNTGKIKPYINFLGFRKGKWHKLDHFDYFMVLKQNKVHNIFSRSNRQLQTKNKKYTLYLMSSLNRDRIPVKNCKSYQEAKKEENRLSKILHMKSGSP